MKQVRNAKIQTYRGDGGKGGNIGKTDQDLANEAKEIGIQNQILIEQNQLEHEQN
jgi:PHP family Zn ribbon phosphoesterase